MWNFQEVLLIILYLFLSLKLVLAFYSWKSFSSQVGDIYKLQEGKAHYDYDYCDNLYFFYLMWYLINSLKLLSENPQFPFPWKYSPFLLIPPLPPKIAKVEVPTFSLLTPLLLKGWGEGRGHYLCYLFCYQITCFRG